MDTLPEGASVPAFSAPALVSPEPEPGAAIDG